MDWVQRGEQMEKQDLTNQKLDKLIKILEELVSLERARK